MAPKKQQTSINEYLKKQEQQLNLTEYLSQQEKQQQSNESYAQSVQQRISNIQQDLEQQRERIEKLESMLDKLIEQLELQFPFIDESLNKIQLQIVIKLEQIDKQFNEVPQLFQYKFSKFQYDIQQLQEKQQQFQINNQASQWKLNWKSSNKMQIRQISIVERFGAIYARRIKVGKNAGRNQQLNQSIRSKYQKNFSVFDQQEQDKCTERNSIIQRTTNIITIGEQTRRTNGLGEGDKDGGLTKSYAILQSGRAESYSNQM